MLCSIIKFPNARIILKLLSGSSYAGANIKVDFNSQQVGFTRRPLANTCSSHLHLSTSYMILKKFIDVLNHIDQWYMDMQ